MIAGNGVLPGLYGQNMSPDKQMHPVDRQTEIITRNVGDRNIFIPTALFSILFSYQDIENTDTPEEKNVRLSMNSKMILAMVSSVLFKNSKGHGIDKEDLEEFEQLSRRMTSTELIEIGVTISSPDPGLLLATFKYRVIRFTTGENGEQILDPPSGTHSTIEVPLSKIELGERMAVNNALKMINREAEHTYFRILLLASRYGLIDPKFGISISEEGISTEMVFEQEKKFASMK